MTGASTRPERDPWDEPAGFDGIDDQTVASALADVWANQQDTVRAQVSELEMASAALLTSTLSSQLQRDLRSTAHKLAGSLGSFGFLDGTQSARQIEFLLGQDHPDPRAVAEATIALRDALPLEGWIPSPAPDPSAPSLDGDAGVLLILTDDSELSTALEHEIQLSSYSCLVQPHPLPKTPLTGTVAVIIDVHGHGIPAIDRELSVLRHPYPLFLLVDEDDPRTRADAARLGARGVLRRDISAGQLIRFVEAEMAGRPAPRPIRVLGVGPEDFRVWFEADEIEGLSKVFWVPDPRTVSDHLLNSPLPDAVVTLWTPEGADAIRMLGADPRTAALPVVIAVAHPEQIPEALDSGGIVVPSWSTTARPALAEALFGAVSLSRRIRGLAHDDATGVTSWTDARRTFAQMISWAEQTNSRVALAQVEIHVNGLTRGELPIGIRHLVARRLRHACSAEDVLARRENRFVIASFGTSPEVLASRLEQARQVLSADCVRRPSGLEADLDLRAAVVTRPQDGVTVAELLVVSSRELTGADAHAPIVIRGGGRADIRPVEVDLVLVEDDPTTAALVERALNLRNLTCSVIDNGSEAAEALARGRIVPRLVLLDIGLPGMDGFGVLSRVKREDSLFRAPVVILSSRYQEQEVQRAFSLGAVDHITKPFGIPALLNRVDRVLQGVNV
jgi:DNA-binding response OmpR family regulator